MAGRAGHDKSRSGATLLGMTPCPDSLSIEVHTGRQDGEVVRPDDRLGVFVQETGVGLEMDDAAGFEEAGVALEEKGRGEAGVFAAAELGVGEGEPDFGAG